MSDTDTDEATDGDEELSPREEEMRVYEKDYERYKQNQQRVNQPFDPETESPSNTRKIKIKRVYERCREAGYDELAEDLRTADTINAQDTMASAIVADVFDGTWSVHGSD